MTPLALPAPPAPTREFVLHGVRFAIYRAPDEMGAASAHRLALETIRLAQSQDRVGFLVMAAPSAFPFYSAFVRLASQSETLRDALAHTDFFQFDDYPLPASHPATFRHLLDTHFYSPLRELAPRITVHPLNVDAPSPARVCAEYTRLVLDAGPDLQLKGVGENGHWGFHEPGIPLDAPPAYIRVETSEENVAQQLRDHPALFRARGEVPRDAYTANVPLFLRTRVCIEDNVPQPSKAFALLAGYATPAIEAAVPTSALKRHANATVRTTEAAAWALVKYVDHGFITSADVTCLVASLGVNPGYVPRVLETMGVEVRA